MREKMIVQCSYVINKGIDKKFKFLDLMGEYPIIVTDNPQDIIKFCKQVIPDKLVMVSNAFPLPGITTEQEEGHGHIGIRFKDIT